MLFRGGRWDQPTHLVLDLDGLRGRRKGGPRLWFDDWMIERMQRHITDGNMPFWSHISAVARRSWLQFVLVVIALVPTYAFVTRDAATGGTAVAVQTAVLLAGGPVFVSIGTGAMVYQMVAAADVLHAYDELSISRKGSGSAPR